MIDVNKLKPGDTVYLPQDQNPCWAQDFIEDLRAFNVVFVEFTQDNELMRFSRKVIQYHVGRDKWTGHTKDICSRCFIQEHEELKPVTRLEYIEF